jgi:predicted acetyltransferase
MTFTYRRAAAGEMPAVMHAVSVGFGGSTEDEGLRRRLARTLIVPEMRLCAYDQDRPIAQLVIVPTSMRWNGPTIAAAGVTDVFTLPSHRRRGVLRELMTRAFSDMRDAGQPVTILEASMAAIYQRFGWAVVYTGLVYNFDPRHLRFVDSIEVPGRLRLVRREEARPRIEQAYRRFTEARTLPLVRGDLEWKMALRLTDSESAPVLVAVYEEAGEVLGYIIYGVGQHGEQRPGPDQRLTVHELVWLTPAAHRSLIQYLAGYDLADSVLIYGMPLDDPLFQHVQEPRLLNTRATDGALARIVDVEAALSGRGYDGDGRLVIAVEDEYAPWNSGAWELEAGAGGGRARRTDTEPEIRATPRVLTLLVAGTLPATTLARNGLLTYTDPCALRTADAIFRTERVPVCLDHWM